MSVPSPPHLKPKYDWHADSEQIGRETTWVKPDGTRVQGICTGCQLAGCMIYDMGTHEKWAGIRFRIKPNDGGRAIWTSAFADKTRPITYE